MRGYEVSPPFPVLLNGKLLRTGGTARELPQPSKTVTLFFFRRCPTPPFNWAATFRERYTTFFKSTEAPWTEMP